MDKLRNELKQSDIVKGVYEGGFRVWEGALNLMRFLSDLDSSEIEGKTIMELGCGQG